MPSRVSWLYLSHLYNAGHVGWLYEQLRAEAVWMWEKSDRLSTGVVAPCKLVAETGSKCEEATKGS